MNTLFLDENIDTDALNSTNDPAAVASEVKYYMNLIDANREDFRTLTPEEEVKYFTAYKENPTKELKDFLFKHNMRLVISVAKKYQSKTVSMTLMDLISEGNLGLLKAIDAFDVTKGFKFSTYATWWIKQKITRSIYDLDGVIRISVHEQERLSKLKVFCYKFNTENGRYPNAKEIAKELQIKLDEAERLMDIYIYIITTISLNSPIGEPERREVEELGNLIEDNKNKDVLTVVCENELREYLNELLDTYIETVVRKPENRKRDRDIILRRTGINDTKVETLETIGAEYGITRERVRQVELNFKKYLAHPNRADILKEYL